VFGQVELCADHVIEAPLATFSPIVIVQLGARSIAVVLPSTAFPIRVEPFNDVTFGLLKGGCK
jgi:hypothetical protein